jgi:predicted enzyme related to lactoylglutathione lyase
MKRRLRLSFATPVWTNTAVTIGGSRGGTMAEDWARPVVHWELQARDPQKQRAFYSAMFNWEIGDGVIMPIPAGIGAPDPSGFTGHILPSDISRFVLYIQVLDLRQSMDSATALGGSITREPFDVPQGDTLTTIAGIADPEGNPIVLVQQ